MAPRIDDAEQGVAPPVGNHSAGIEALNYLMREGAAQREEREVGILGLKSGPLKALLGPLLHEMTGLCHFPAVTINQLPREAAACSPGADVRRSKRAHVPGLTGFDWV